ncbi:hypothetical protein ABE28_006170 [Peribacillus muralis]|uniref:Uncharacterized protein n=1 Tax=Peribacillus muralis TaxID=264697 RepID=A0A1B3XL55_9BACI|nr:hypothetical protein ABE28_006170 [Peribacillus muralis]
MLEIVNHFTPSYSSLPLAAVCLPDRRKTPTNREIRQGFSYLYEQRGWEKFHDVQTKGYKFGM